MTLLEDAGWANVGKANLHEFAYGITSQNPHYGTVPNPVAPGRVTGGSSGGNAAALAAGLADGALGTDSGGSIRIPAAWCGVVGLKPSHGLVPMEGCFPLAPSFDTAGPMAREVRTCAEMMEALVPGFERERLDSLAELRVAAGAGLELDRLEGLDHPERVDLPSTAGVHPVFMREVAETHASLFAEHRELYGDNVAAKIERCLAVSDADHERARVRHEDLRTRFAELFERFDLLLTPAVILAPPPADVDELEIRERAISLTFPFNATGAPALVLPAAGAGAANALQAVAAPGRDGLVLAAGELLERGLRR